MKFAVKKQTVFIFLFLFLFNVSLTVAAEETEINWPDLVKKITFEDPFEKLTTEQLRLLSLYVRIKEMQQYSPDRLSDSMIQEAMDAEVSLRQQDVDIEGLLAKREEIKNLRKQKAYGVVEELDSNQVKMPGFALPLEFSEKRVTEFLLVPWVGACIHTPPPPPNQIVYVTFKDGFEALGRFEPVWVHGTMSVKQSKKNLYLNDGSADINAGYTIAANDVAPYNNK